MTIVESLSIVIYAITVAAANEAGAIALGNIPAGQHRAVWIRRTVNAAAAASNDTATLRVKGDTQA